METDNEASGKQVIARAAAVLKTLEGRADGLTIAEITRASELPRTTAQRIVVALQAQQMVVAVDGRVRLGPALTRLAGSTFLDVVGIARPHVEALSRATRETVNLSVLRGNHAVLVDQVASDHELRVVTPVGSALPLHCTAHGKALLAAMGDDEIAARLGDEWERRTRNTIAALAPLLKELASARPACPMTRANISRVSTASACGWRPARPSVTPCRWRCPRFATRTPARRSPSAWARPPWRSRPASEHRDATEATAIERSIDVEWPGAVQEVEPRARRIRTHTKPVRTDRQHLLVAGVGRPIDLARHLRTPPLRERQPARGHGLAGRAVRRARAGRKIAEDVRDLTRVHRTVRVVDRRTRGGAPPT